MSTAVAVAPKRFEVTGIIPAKIKETFAKIKGNVQKKLDEKEIKRLLKEVYAELGIKKINELYKAYEEAMTHDSETAENGRVADAYNTSREVTAFAGRGIKGDKKVIRNTLITSAVGILGIGAETLLPNLFELVSGALSAISGFAPIAIVGILISAGVQITRAVKSKRGNANDYKEKMQATEAELKKLMVIVQAVEAEFKSRQNEFLEARRVMKKAEYREYVAREIKAIVKRHRLEAEGTTPVAEQLGAKEALVSQTQAGQENANQPQANAPEAKPREEQKATTVAPKGEQKKRVKKLLKKSELQGLTPEEIEELEGGMQ